jgi:hypothetical protein
MWSQARTQAQTHQVVVGREKYRYFRFRSPTAPCLTGRVIAPALRLDRSAPRMGGMLDALFEWTGMTGTQLLTSVAGGVILAVIARLVMTWYLTK